MLGSSIESATITAAGVAGDRAYAVVDRSDGTVASAKHPRKWARLLEVSARFDGEPTAEGTASPVVLEFPDGSAARSDDAAAVDAALSSFLDRDVALVSTPPAGATFEEVWPDIEGLAPSDFIASTSKAHEDSGEPVSAIGLSQMAPPGTFFDVAPLHLLTTSTLAELERIEPQAGFDVRRYRPNVLVDTGDAAGFIENDWKPPAVARMGEVEAPMLFATMRCVMTTLAQGGADPLPADRSTLQAIARHNRIDLGFGVWACAGVYASVTTPGVVRVGDDIAITRS